MSTHFFKYVKWEEYLAAKELTANVFAYSASKQFVTPSGRRKVGKGDVIWTFTVPLSQNGSGRSGILCLCGRLTVMGEVTDNADAVARHIGTEREMLFGAEEVGTYYALADWDEAGEYVEINGEDLAAAIRFESPSDKLALVGGIIAEYNQLRALRPLAAKTVSLLNSLLPHRPACDASVLTEKGLSPPQATPF
jgi:hypothetical protein